MLVEILTADFTERKDHLGPGDRTVIDMTFVSSVAPGDHLTSMDMFVRRWRVHPQQSVPGNANEEIDLSIQYLDATASGTSDERFHIVVKLNSNQYAWMQTYAEDFTDSIDEITFDGSNLEVTGELYVNESYSASHFPGGVLPEEVSLTPFTLHASCG